MKQLRAYLIVTLAIVIVGCATTGVPIDKDIELVLSPNVIQTLDAHKPNRPVKSPIVSFQKNYSVRTGVEQSNNQDFQMQSAFAWQDDGFLYSTEKTVIKSRGGREDPLVYSSASICALEYFLGEGSSSFQSYSTIPVRIGTAFVPLNSGGVGLSSTRSRIVGFATNAKNLCAPERGSTFAIQVSSETQRKDGFASGTINRIHPLTRDSTCKVSNEEEQASKINPAFKGNFIGVKCTNTEPTTGGATTDYAFLVDSGMYVTLSARGGQSSRTYTYTNVVYK